MPGKYQIDPREFSPRTADRLAAEFTKPVTARAMKIARNKAENRIDAAYQQTCCGIQIDVMDIGKVFRRGHELIAQGADDAALAAGILAFVRTIAK